MKKKTISKSQSSFVMESSKNARIKGLESSNTTRKLKKKDTNIYSSSSSSISSFSHSKSAFDVLIKEAGSKDQQDLKQCNSRLDVIETEIAKLIREKNIITKKKKRLSRSIATERNTKTNQAPQIKISHIQRVTNIDDVISKVFENNSEKENFKRKNEFSKIKSSSSSSSSLSSIIVKNVDLFHLSNLEHSNFSQEIDNRRIPNYSRSIDTINTSDIHSPICSQSQLQVKEQQEEEEQGKNTRNNNKMKKIQVFSTKKHSKHFIFKKFQGLKELLYSPKIFSAPEIGSASWMCRASCG